MERKWLGDVWLRASGHADQSTKDIKGKREREELKGRPPGHAMPLTEECEGWGVTAGGWLDF